MTWGQHHGRATRRAPSSFLRILAALGTLCPVTAATLIWAHPAAADQLSQEKAEAAQIVAQIQAQGARLAVLSEQYDQAQIRVEQLDQQVSQTQSQISRTEDQVGADQARLRTQAVQEYVTGGSITGLDQLFAPGGERAAALNEYESVATGSIAGTIDSLNRSEAELGVQEGQLRSTEATADAVLAAAGAARRGAQAELTQQQATLAGVKGQIATLVAQEEAAQAAAQAAAFQARVSSAQSAATESLPPAPPAPGDSGAQAVSAAESQIGVPYVWAGATPGQGFDCSGLTMWAWARAGVSLAHSAAAQYDETEHVPLSDLQPGDLLFYDEGGSIGHVTMYVGPGEMVQAMETGTLVQITGIWTSGLVGAGRP